MKDTLFASLQNRWQRQALIVGLLAAVFSRPTTVYCIIASGHK